MADRRSLKVVDSLKGQLLIAGPGLTDPNFRRSVILVCAHDDDGALGLVVNRPADMLVADTVPELSDTLGAGEPLWLGGPVAPDGVVLLAEFSDAEGAHLVDGDLGLVTTEADLDDLPGRTRRARAFLGHAGWGPGQLDEELEREDWIVAALETEDAFADEPETMWSAVLRRLGGSFALVARMPVDPSVN